MLSLPPPTSQSTSVEPGQYVHNPDWDLTPYQLWKRRQAAKGVLVQVRPPGLACLMPCSRPRLTPSLSPRGRWSLLGR